MQDLFRNRLLQLANGSLFTQLLHVAAKLGVADALAASPMPISELANHVKADPQALYRILRALAMLGVFSELDERRFELTPMAELLRDDHPESVRNVAIMMGEPWWWNPYGKLSGAVRSGDPACDAATGTGFFDCIANDQDAGTVFDAAMTELSRPHIEGVMAVYDFSSFRTLVDVGGGNGALIASILRACPDSSGTLFDLPEVVSRAQSLNDNSDILDRCNFVAGNFFIDVPAGADAYLLKGVIHDWDDAQACSILRNCRKHMSKDAKALLIEWNIPELNNGAPGKLTDITMLSLFGGRERTRSEYESLLASADLQLVRAIPTPLKMDIIECVAS